MNICSQVQAACIGTKTEAQKSEHLSPGPLFVVGMWRSGTSLLYALLNQNPQIGLMYESDLPVLSSLFFVPRKSASWMFKWECWNNALSRHAIDTSRIPRNISDLPTAFHAVSTQYAMNKGATVWGCKSPFYYDRMTKLGRWFPNAKFVVIWRDPADVCRSIVRAAKKSTWFARSGMDLRALLGYYRMKQEADALERRGASIHHLQYDDLVRDTPGTMSAICDFIGIPFDARMTSLEGADLSALYDGDHHSMVKSGRVAANCQRCEVLSPELKNKIERYVVYWGKKYGGTWQLNAATCDGTKAASLFERTCDRVRLAHLRCVDRMIPLIFSFMPLSLWRLVRPMKYRTWVAKLKDY